MSATYRTINWNRNKIVYDLVLLCGVALYITVFVLLTPEHSARGATLSPVIVLMRALSTCAFVMLTIVLCIGPLARIDRRFLPLLYNRRHFGVLTFIVAALHAALAVFWYHSFAVENPLVSVFTSGGSYESITAVPFQAFGALALVLLYVLAATSHDYWNANLGAPLWKALHMLVYPAYALLILHVVFGALQTDNTGLLPVLVIGSVLLVGTLHCWAALRCAGADYRTASTDWVDVCAWHEIENNRAVTVDIDKQERIAVFRFDGNKLCAVANACQHQNGPLGEGCVINGHIVCPWHGYEYRPEDGRSPPPFSEKIATYELKITGERVQLNPRALGEGVARPIIRIKAVSDVPEQA